MLTGTTTFIKKHIFVISTLLISGVLRWGLILKGGQYYFPDESRYGIAQDALVLLLDGKVKTALITLLDELAHAGFKLTALIPALFEYLFNTSPALPAIFFSFFSIFSLLLIWLITLKVGASERVANYSLLIAACSLVLLYYSRHLFPYDQAMFFGLSALYVALINDSKPGVSFMCGTLSFLCFVTYNGYWAIATFPLLVNAFNDTNEKYWFVKRPTFLGLGFLTPLALFLSVCIAIGKDFFSDYDVYLRKIVQGSFNEGWRLPFEYFWQAENWFIVIVGILTLIALFSILKNGNKYLYVSLGGTIFIYLCLVIPSNVTHTFVVYARTTRQLMPFLVLTAAYGLAYIHSQKPGGRWLANILIAVILIQAAWNYRLANQIVYPREFVQEVQKQYPDFKISSKMMRFYAPLVCKNNGLLAKNFHYIYTWPQPSLPVRGEILIKAAHPLNFRPHQYDGFTLEVREAIRKENFEMILYKPDASYLVSYKKEIENCDQESNKEGRPIR